MFYILLFVFNCVLSMPIRENVSIINTTTLTTTYTTTISSINLLESINNTNYSKSINNMDSIISSCVAVFCIVMFFFIIVFCKCQGQRCYLDTELLKQTCCCK